MDWLPAVAVLAVGMAAVSIVIGTLRTGISPMPSSSAQRTALLNLLPTDFAGIVFELGAGWGGLAVALASRYPRAQVVAFESALVPWLFLRLRILMRRRSNLQLRFQDFFTADWAEADAFTTYLYPGAMDRLARELPRRAKNSALLLTHTFAARGLERVREERLVDTWQTPVTLYRCVAER